MAGFSKQKYFRLAKGFYGRSKNCLKITIPRVEKSLQKAYVGRKLRPRTLRRNWIMTISAATRDLNMPYSRFINSLTHSNLELNRKILANLATNEPYSFKAVFDEVSFQAGRLPEERITL
jgi:large subunit ribosomal protein L20